MSGRFFRLGLASLSLFTDGGRFIGRENPIWRWDGCDYPKGNGVGTLLRFPGVDATLRKERILLRRKYGRGRTGVLGGSTTYANLIGTRAQPE